MINVDVGTIFYLLSEKQQTQIQEAITAKFLSAVESVDIKLIKGEIDEAATGFVTEYLFDDPLCHLSERQQKKFNKDFAEKITGAIV